MILDPSLWGTYAGTFADWEGEGVREPYYATPDGKVTLLQGGIDLLYGIGDGLFQTIVADPPWDYRDPLQRGRHSSRGAENHYELMKIGNIAALPVRQLAANDAHLYLWVTNAFMVEGHQIAIAWGFTVRTILTWVKPSIGMGHFFRNNTEHVLFATRGRLPPLRRDCPTSFAAPRREHSEKPCEFFEIVESMSPEPRIELFGRSQRPGWTVWGYEAGHKAGRLSLRMPVDVPPELPQEVMSL